MFLCTLKESGKLESQLAVRPLSAPLENRNHRPPRLAESGSLALFALGVGHKGEVPPSVGLPSFGVSHVMQQQVRSAADSQGGEPGVDEVRHGGLGKLK
jgi:hypothetical protein